jgi:hypothetical protein
VSFFTVEGESFCTVEGESFCSVKVVSFCSVEIVSFWTVEVESFCTVEVVSFCSVEVESNFNSAEWLSKTQYRSWVLCHHSLVKDKTTRETSFILCYNYEAAKSNLLPK